MQSESPRRASPEIPRCVFLIKVTLITREHSDIGKLFYFSAKTYRKERVLPPSTKKPEQSKRSFFYEGACYSNCPCRACYVCVFYFSAKPIGRKEYFRSQPKIKRSNCPYRYCYVCVTECLILAGSSSATTVVTVKRHSG